MGERLYFDKVVRGRMTEQTKRCTKCNQLLPTSEFNKAKLGKYGVRSWCKHCNDEYTKQWRKDHPQNAFESSQRYKIKALLHYGGRPTSLPVLW